MTELEIVLENARCDGEYFPGDMVAGHVLVKVNVPINTEFLQLLVDGRSESNIIQSKYDYKTNKDIQTPFRTPIIFNNDNFILWRDNHLTVGVHKFPFKYHLSSHSGSTYESEYGKIQNIIKASLVCPGGVQIEKEHNVKVTQIIDLNKLEDARKPIEGTETKNVGIWGNRHGDVTMKYYIDKTGYVPGDNINIKMTINNESKVAVIGAAAYLYQKVCIFGYSDNRIMKHDDPFPRVEMDELQDYKESNNVIAEIKEKIHIERNGECEISLRVPNTQPTHTLPNINIKYTLLVQAEADCSVGDKIYQEVPILIGTVPIGGRAPELNTEVHIHSTATNPNTGNPTHFAPGTIPFNNCPNQQQYPGNVQYQNPNSYVYGQPIGNQNPNSMTYQNQYPVPGPGTIPYQQNPNIQPNYPPNNVPYNNYSNQPQQVYQGIPPNTCPHQQQQQYPANVPYNNQPQYPPGPVQYGNPNPNIQPQYNPNVPNCNQNPSMYGNQPQYPPGPQYNPHPGFVNQPQQGSNTWPNAPTYNK